MQYFLFLYLEGLGSGLKSVTGGSIFDPFLLFDLDDFVIAAVYGNYKQTSSVHTLSLSFIRDEPEHGQDNEQ